MLRLFPSPLVLPSRASTEPTAQFSYLLVVTDGGLKILLPAYDLPTKLQGYSTVEQSTSMLHTQRAPVITKDERRKPVFDSKPKTSKYKENTNTGIQL